MGMRCVPRVCLTSHGACVWKSPAMIVSVEGYSLRILLSTVIKPVVIVALSWCCTSYILHRVMCDFWVWMVVKRHRPFGVAIVCTTAGARLAAMIVMQCSLLWMRDVRWNSLLWNL